MSRQMFIDSEWVSSSTGKDLPVYEPSTGRVIEKVPEASRDDVVGRSMPQEMLSIWGPGVSCLHPIELTFFLEWPRCSKKGWMSLRDSRRKILAKASSKRGTTICPTRWTTLDLSRALLELSMVSPWENMFLRELAPYEESP